MLDKNKEQQPMFEKPSSKAIVSLVVSTILTVAAVLEAAEVQSVDLPPWLIVLGGILGPIGVYLKKENRPSSSAQAAAKAK